MAVEIERKFLIDPAFQPSENNSVSVTEIKQGYLSDQPGRIVRLRTMTTKLPNSSIDQMTSAFITVKGKKVGMSAGEWEYPIPYKEADEMMRELVEEETIIHKTRYRVPIVGDRKTVYEVDVFHGRLAGIRMAEIELPSEDFKDYRLAPFLRQEVTTDARFSNSFLSTAGPMHVAMLAAMSQSGAFE